MNSVCRNIKSSVWALCKLHVITDSSASELIRFTTFAVDRQNHI
jgi:hypothetical protein